LSELAVLSPWQGVVLAGFHRDILGASIGDAISYWTGRIYKEQLGISPFSRHPGLLTAEHGTFARRWRL